MSATILSSTSQADGGSTLSPASAYSLDSFVQCECQPQGSLTLPCLAALLLSADGGNSYCPVDVRRFDLGAPASFETFRLADFADKKFPGVSGWFYASGLQAPVGLVRTFKPPWDHFRILTYGNAGAAVTVSAIGDSGALSGGGASGQVFPVTRGWAVAPGSSLSSGSGQFPAVVMPYAGTLAKVQVLALTNPSGGGFSFQITQNGTNIFSSAQSVAASTTTVQTFSTFAASPLTFAAGDVFALVPSSVGTGVQGVTFQMTGLEQNS